MAMHSSILAWEILWTEKPGRLPSSRLKRAGHDLVSKQQQRDRQVDGDIEVYEEISTDITDIPTGICIYMYVP